MDSLLPQTIASLLVPYFEGHPRIPVPPALYEQLSAYLDLLLRWNARTNLTAIRDPEEIVRRHFGESLFVGRHLGTCETLLDFGSGAGFPGLPIQLLRPEIAVTLSESQNKKATFLREAVRSLGLKTEVWAGRVESMDPHRKFDVVTMRAVDDMEAARPSAMSRVAPSGKMAILTTSGATADSGTTIPLPVSEAGVLWFPLFHVKHTNLE